MTVLNVFHANECILLLAWIVQISEAKRHETRWASAIFLHSFNQKQGCESEKKGKKQTLPENIGDKQIVVRVMVTQTEA